jgi:ABC-type branched-subunit amino acid transport system ATPase component
MNAPGPLLEVSGLSKRYGGLVAIDKVDLEIDAGAIAGIIGPNGAGKSTLIGLIGGALAPSAGTIRLAGRDVSGLPASERARAGIGRTYQIPRPFLDMTVEENLEVAQYSLQPFGASAAARRERDALLTRAGLADVARAPARLLPLLRRKRLEVARALALKPRLLLLDEVGAGLIDSEIDEFIGLIRSIIDAGTAIVIVEHVIRIVRECCSQLTVLNFGRKLIEGPTAEILANDEVAAVYLGTAAAQRGCGGPPAREPVEPPPDAPAKQRAALAALVAPKGATASAPLLRLERICAGYGQARVLNGVDLSIGQGEAAAILGANGAGKTTLAGVVSGALRPTSGRLIIAGKDATGLPPHRIAALGIAHCMEGRRIFPALSVRENLSIAARGVAGGEAQRRFEAVYDLFPVLAERRDQPGASMSGGQQQMLAIGRALMARPRLVIFDEISLGLAPVVMDRLYQALRLLKEAGVTLVVIEQDIDRALALADAAYVLDRGVIGLSGRPDEVRNDVRLKHIYVGAAD